MTIEELKVSAELMGFDLVMVYRILVGIEISLRDFLWNLAL